MDLKTLSEINNSVPTLVPQIFKRITDNTFKIASVYQPLDRALDIEEIKLMHSSALGDQFELVPESVEFIGEQQDGRNLITSIVTANIVSMEYNKKNTHGMRVVSANVFVDDDNHIWTVTGKGDKRRIVQSVKEDFNAILASRINSRRDMLIAKVAYNGMPEADVLGGDFVLFFNAGAGEIDSGFALTDNENYKVYSMKANEFVDATPDMIIRAQDGNQLPNSKSLRAMNDGDFDLTDKADPAALNRYADYMRTLYNGTDYFAKLTDLLAFRRRTGAENLPVSTMKV